MMVLKVTGCKNVGWINKYAIGLMVCFILTIKLNFMFIKGAEFLMWLATVCPQEIADISRSNAHL